MADNENQLLLSNHKNPYYLADEISAYPYSPSSSSSRLNVMSGQPALICLSIFAHYLFKQTIYY